MRKLLRIYAYVHFIFTVSELILTLNIENNRFFFAPRFTFRHSFSLLVSLVISASTSSGGYSIGYEFVSECAASAFFV